MNIVIVDDEILAVNHLFSILQEIDSTEKLCITSFTDSVDALDHLLKNRADVVFLDVEMPELSGVNLADELISFYKNPPEIIFLTAYPQFSLDAWNRGAAAYVLKPYKPGNIIDALEKARINIKGKASVSKKPFFRCFPEFDVFSDGVPIDFKSKKAKELLAFLVHHHGGWVSLDQIAFELLEEAPEDSAKSYIRQLVHRLRKSLAPYGLDTIIESKYGKYRIIAERIDCDYYHYLDGDRSLFMGEYLTNYSWSLETNAYMSRDM